MLETPYGPKGETHVAPSHCPYKRQTSLLIIDPTAFVCLAYCGCLLSSISAMGPVRKTKADAYPPTPPSADDDEYAPEIPSGPALVSHKASPYPKNHNNNMSTTPLQRGSACLSCRKRKMKCDGSRPVCQQCSRANRAADCEYDDGKTKTRTQILQEKIQRLEARVHELEGNPSGTTGRGTALQKQVSPNSLSCPSFD